MNILAIDTSTKRLCLGIMNHKGKIVGYNLDSKIRHTQSLLPMIKRALRRLKLAIDEVDYFAVGLGPGSFTGLRIGLATIKGFTSVLKKPVVGLPTLDALAYNVWPGGGGVICPLIDAKRNLLFTALYEISVNHKLKRRTPYLLISLEDLLKQLHPHKLVTFLGDGLGLYQERLKQELRNSTFLSEDAWYPKAENLVKLTERLINQGRFSDATRIKPIYLYPKDCQIRNAKTR